jgi:pimeloyl-ACP methyl ester carboxylesterase
VTPGVQPVEESRPVPEPWQHYYQSQRLRLSYWTWGDAENPPLILVHGGRDHSRSWDRVAEAFRDDYHVLACDLRGHGDSEAATGSLYGLPEHVLDLVALIDLVGGRASVVGHSFGGAITLLAAGTFPEKFERIVDIEGAGARLHEGRGEPTPKRLREWATRTRAFEHQTPRVYPTIEEARDRMQEANPRLSPEMAMHLARWGTLGIDGGYVWKFDPWVRGRTPFEVGPEDMAQVWAAVEAPVLHLAGGASRFHRDRFEGKPLDDYFAASRTVVVPDAGHWIHHDQLDITVREIRQFLAAGAGIGEAAD